MSSIDKINSVVTHMEHKYTEDKCNSRLKLIKSVRILRSTVSKPTDASKPGRMTQVVVISSVISLALSISLAIISVLFLSRIRDEENNFKMQLESLQKQFANFKVDTSSEFAFHREYLRVVVALNSSFQMVVDKVEGMNNQLRALSKVCSPSETYNSSLEMAHRLTSTTDRDLNTSKSVVEGIIVAVLDGVFTISLPSLQQIQIANGSANHVAFDWNSRKVYWTEIGVKGTKKGNLDGTDLESLVVGGRSMRLLAVDSNTGNIYYRNILSSHQDIIVCNRSGEKCSVVATSPDVYSFDLYPSTSLMFWANRDSVMKANMDGTNPRVILTESIASLAVDETSERLYWISKQKTILSIAVGNRPVIKYDPWRYVASCDLNGKDRRVLWNTTEELESMAISREVVYFSSPQGILSGRKNEGHDLSYSMKTTAPIYGMALYGSKGRLRENPCAGYPCSHLCVPKLESFACLCPQGKHLDQNGTTCV